MSKEFWSEKWRQGQIGFHEDQVHPDLQKHAGCFGSNSRVLVPLCGKTLDLAYLVSQGHHVVGVEIVEQAVNELYAALSVEPVVRRQEEVVVFESPGLTVLCGDVFNVTTELTGAVDAIWDRAALVALPEDLRRSYAEHLRTLTGPGTVLLQNVLEYDQALMEGPPWSVSEAEFRRLYAGADITRLERRNMIAEQPGWRDKGHKEWWGMLFSARW